MFDADGSNVYNGSDIAIKCTTWYNNEVPEKIRSVGYQIDTEGVTSPCFIPTYDQVNDGWDYFDSNTDRIFCGSDGVAYRWWTASGYNTLAYHVQQDGSLTMNIPLNNYGFRPSLALNRSAFPSSGPVFDMLPTPGETVNIGGYDYIIGNADSETVYVLLKYWHENTVFDAGNSSVYAGSDIAAKCESWANETIPTWLASAGIFSNVNTYDVSAYCFIPTCDQLEQTWEYFKDNPNNRIFKDPDGEVYVWWTSTPNDTFGSTESLWLMTEDGTSIGSGVGDAENSHGFRPALAIKRSAFISLAGYNVTLLDNTGAILKNTTVTCTNNGQEYTTNDLGVIPETIMSKDTSLTFTWSTSTIGESENNDSLRQISKNTYTTVVSGGILGETQSLTSANAAIEVGETVYRIMVPATVGRRMCIGTDDFIIAHVEGNSVYAIKENWTTNYAFNSNSSNVYVGSDIAGKCIQYYESLPDIWKNNATNQVVTEGETNACFIPTYSQVNGGWEYFNSAEHRTFPNMFGTSTSWWTSTAVPSGPFANNAYHIKPNGSIGEDISCDTSIGFRPAIALKKELFITMDDITPGKSLSEYEPGEIACISDAGLASSYFSLGDTVDIELSSIGTMTLEIADFDHDYLTGNTSADTAGITFITKDLLYQTYLMNTTDTNVGGFPDSDLHDTLSITIWSAIPIAWRTAIRPIYKRYGTGNGTSKGEWFGSKIWVPLEYEMFGTTKYSPATEHSTGNARKYPIFTNNNCRIKKMNNGTGSAQWYWEASPDASNATHFCGVGPNGSAGGTNYASDASGVSFGFCI